MSEIHKPITKREIAELEVKILEVAKQCDLDPFPTIFELVDYEEMNEIIAYSGFPGRFPHWRYGMEYEINKKSNKWGLHKIYELVINNNPSYAYLLKSNSKIEQKIVIAHVLGHSDFFKNNLWFQATNRKMLDEIANHSTKVQNYIDKYGHDNVENWIDTCISIENLIDYHSIFRTKHKKESSDFHMSQEDEPAKQKRKLNISKYVKKFLDSENGKKQKKDEPKPENMRFPKKPQKDIMSFMIEHAPMQNWQSDILSMIREEVYYFAPQALTKIMNEGWAAYWHAKILTEKMLTDEEVVDFAEINAGVLGGPVAMNPYKLGFELYREIEDRWNKGKFGLEYELCDDLKLKKNWNLRLGKGRNKIFEVRKIYNDITFIDEFVNDEFCEKHKLFVYRQHQDQNGAEIVSKDYKAIKKVLLFRLTNMGHPIIELADGNYKNRSELMLKHKHEGDEIWDLQLDEARDTLKSLYKIWKRPINLETIYKQKSLTIRFDGEKVEEERH
ncbi:MAG: SpoVR family protein [Planctomycetes bacterium]|nr:SpoVR family protein [Planctomycetota bacterium]